MGFSRATDRIPMVFVEFAKSLLHDLGLVVSHMHYGPDGGLLVVAHTDGIRSMRITKGRVQISDLLPLIR